MMNKMKTMKYLMFLSFFFAVAIHGSAQPYPAESYELSDDGLTLKKWNGSEAIVDMNADPTLSQITTIENYAFQYSACEVVKVSAKVIKIFTSSFIESSLREVYLPASLKEIEIGSYGSDSQGAFPTLRLLDIDKSNPYFVTDGLTIYNKSKTKLIMAGWGKTEGVFHIPSTVKEIGMDAFEGSSYSGIVIPESVDYIGDAAFVGTKCQSLILPSSLKRIGYYALFMNKLHEVTFLSQEPPFGEHGVTFMECYNLKAIYVPQESLEKYKNSLSWYAGKIYPIDVCDLSDLPTDNAYYQATEYLCSRTVLSGSKVDGKTAVEEPLKRAHLAKIAFRGLYLTNGGKVPSAVPSDNYPTLYTDLTDKTAYYYQAARAMMYLEYGDGVAPFDRNRLAFEPEGNIARVHTLKVLMEAFNIQPDLEGTDNPFPADADVTALAKSNPRLMGYVRKAAALGIITKANSAFRPYDDCLRGEAFTMLARIMQKIEAGEIADPKPQQSDYFEPLNTTLRTIALGAGLQLGNFSHYTKTSFALSGVMPLLFGHTYNSYNTTLPSVFYGDKGKTDADESYLPLGDGWSHNYHSFVTVVGDYSAGADNGLRAIVHWGGGGIDVYKSDGTKLVPESMGVYDEMTYSGGDDLTIKSKAQVTYRFSKQGGTGAAVMYLADVTDRNGNTLTVSYEDGQNGSKRISSVSDGNRSLRFAYLSGTDLLAEVKDPLGRSVKFAYFDNALTGKKQLKSFTDAEGNTTTYDYADLTKAGASKLLARIQLPKGNYVENEYDTNCRLKSTVSGQDGVPATRTSVSVAADFGSTISTKSQVEVERGSQTSTYSYTFNGNNVVTEVAGAEGMYVKNSYDNAQCPELPTAMQSNGVNISSVEYDGRGNVTSITLTGDGTQTKRRTYDAMNNLTSYTDPMGNTTQYSYDAKGNLTGVSAPEGVATSTTVDSRGLPVAGISPMGVKTEFEYNEYGNVVKISLPALGLTNTAVYDAASRLTSATDAKGRTNSYAYNNNDLLTSETDAMSHVTRFAYDKNDNLTGITNAKGGVTTMSYDNTTDLLVSVEFAGAKKQYSYNEDGTVSTFTKPDGTTLSYSYDGLGRMTSDGVNTYSYDDKMRLESVSDGSKTLTLSYDGFNRITGTSCDRHSNTYTYDDNGNCTSINDTRYSHDALNRLTAVSFGDKTISYTYRKDSQLAQVEYPNGMTTTFGYDAVGRLTSKQTTLRDGTVVAGYTFVLDKAGNITEQTMEEPYGDIALPNENTSYSYNDGNRITKAGNISFTFDANGNTTSRGSETYSWNSLDRLTKAGSTPLAYDPLGLIASYGDITFTTDPLGIGNVLSDSRSGAEYIYGNGLEARVTGEKVSYYVTDCRGSVVAIVDDNGNITHKYQYDESGRVTQKEEADYNPFQYVGKYGVMALDDHLYYMRARHYDPTIGRFLSEDPIWSTNLYPYADNNPVMGIDPRGLYYNKYLAEQSTLSIQKQENLNMMRKLVESYRVRNLRFTSDASDEDRDKMKELIKDNERIDIRFAEIALDNMASYSNSSQQQKEQPRKTATTQAPSDDPYKYYSQAELEEMYNKQMGTTNNNGGKLNIQKAIKNQSDYTEMGYGKTGSIRGVSSNPGNWPDIIYYLWKNM